MMKERATDFRLDSKLRSACEEDIMYTCGWEDVSDPQSFGLCSIGLVLLLQSVDSCISVK